MSSLYSSHLLSASTHLRICSKTRHHALFPSNFEHGSSQRIKERNRYFGGLLPYGVLQNSTSNVVYPLNAAAGHSSDPRKSKLDQLTRKARKLWDSSPQPVKDFPWDRAIDNFVQLTFDLVLEVIKYLSVPLLFVTSLSEMSYCAHQKKLKLVLIPLLLGIAVAAVLRQTALDISPGLKDAEVPWHLICMAVLFTLLKLPGPYYPYWGRIFIPHFANGGLVSTLLFAFLWSRRPKQASGSTLVQDVEVKS